MKHRDAYPEDGQSPSLEEYLRTEGEADASPARRIIVSPTGPRTGEVNGELPQDILIVASKLKDYVRAKAGLSTSQNVLDKLSDIVRRHVDAAIVKAMNDGRKTLMDRDF